MPIYKPAACYKVVRPSDGTVLAAIRRGVYQIAGETPDTLHPYSGTVSQLDGRYAIRLRVGGVVGVLDGQWIRTVHGEDLQLIQVSRPAEWLSLDDPDAYRAFRDAALVLKENGVPSAARLVLQVGAAPFDPCPACHDHYGFAEGCAECCGWGFVPEVGPSEDPAERS